MTTRTGRRSHFVASSAFKRIALTAVLFAGVLLLSEPRAAQSQVEEIAAAWSSRAEGIKDARIEWLEKTVIPQGSQFKGYPGPVESAPSKDLLSERAFTAVLNGTKQLRFEQRGSEWRGDTGNLSSPRSGKTTVLNNGETKSLGNNPDSREGHAWGSVERGSQSIDFLNLHRYVPVFWYCRPFEPDSVDLRDDIRQATVASRRSLVSGAECIELRRSISPNSSVTYWVDPKREYLLLRANWGSASASEDLEIDYVEAGDGASWRPASWKYVLWNSAGPKPRLTTSTTATVTGWQINQGVAQSEFELEFPVGTWVIGDDSDGERSDYLVTGANSTRPIYGVELERGAKHHELMTTEPGEARAQVRHFPWLWWIVTGIVGALALVLCWTRYASR